MNIHNTINMCEQKCIREQYSNHANLLYIRISQIVNISIRSSSFSQDHGVETSLINVHPKRQRMWQKQVGQSLDRIEVRHEYNCIYHFNNKIMYIRIQNRIQVLTHN